MSSLVVRMTDCETEGASSIPDEIANVFALIHRLPKNHRKIFARVFYGSTEKLPPATSSTGFYLEPIKVPSELWAEEPFKVQLRIFFLIV